MGTHGPETPLPASISTPSRNNLTRNNSRSHLQSTLSYIWTTNDSMFAGDVDRWIGGDTTPAPTDIPTHTRVRHLHSFRLPGSAPRPAFPRPLPPASGFWYVAAMILPLINVNVCRNWRCTPSAFLNTAELMLSQVGGYCSRARSRVRRLAREQGARDLFAGAMDVVLVVYAIGFLLLSLYQASVFQQF